MLVSPTRLDFDMRRCNDGVIVALSGFGADVVPGGGAKITSCTGASKVMCGCISCAHVRKSLFAMSRHSCHLRHARSSGSSCAAMSARSAAGVPATAAVAESMRFGRSAESRCSCCCHGGSCPVPPLPPPSEGQSRSPPRRPFAAYSRGHATYPPPLAEAPSWSRRGRLQARRAKTASAAAEGHWRPRH